MQASRVEIPRLRSLSRHAGRHIIEATLIPLALFYGAISLFGTLAALLVALGWSYLAIGRRLVTGRRVPGILVLGAFGLTARTIVALGTGSLFLYFLQPTLTNVVVAGIFLASLSTHRPMAERLAADFCPLPGAFLAHPGVRRFFNQLTLLWAGVQLANAGVTIALLVSQPVRTYLWARSLSSFVITGGAIAVSTLWFRRSMRRHGITVVSAAA
jgi:uncharacterized membrane protein